MWIYSCSLVLNLLIAGGTYAALPLPSYFKPCARTNPQFHQCVLEHAREAIPILAKGDRKYGFPILEPLEIAELRVENGPNQAGINLRMTNIKAYGVSRAALLETHYDIENSINYFNVTFPRMEILSDYEINGRILLLPIVGRGKLNVTLLDIKAFWEVDSRMEEKNGERFARFSNPRTTLSSSRDYFNLTNLFNGDKFLGEEMNRLLNDNWRDAHKDLVAFIVKGVGELITSFIDKFGSHVTYDTWFPRNCDKYSSTWMCAFKF